MVNLYANLGTSPLDYLEAGNGEAIAVSMEPGHGTVKRGTVLYRKTGVLYAPAAAANVVTDNSLVVLREDIDTDASATTAAAASAYIKGDLLANQVVLSDDTNLTAAQAHVLRKQGLILKPFDDLTTEADIADNSVTVSVTVSNDGHGTGSASPASGTKGTEVTLTATPAEGYEFDAWELVSGDVTIVGNTFTIVDQAVEVKATFKSST